MIKRKTIKIPKPIKNTRKGSIISRRVKYIVSRADARRSSNGKISYITLEPNYPRYVSGSEINSIKIIVGVTFKSEAESTLEFYKDDTLINSQAISKTGEYSYIYTNTMTGSSGDIIRFTVNCITDEKTSSAGTSISFIGTSYYGVIYDEDEINEENIKKLTTDDKIIKEAVYSYSTGEKLGRFVYAYPKVLGTISSIKDTDYSFNYSNSVKKQELTIDNETYYVIYLKRSACFDNVSITFN